MQLTEFYAQMRAAIDALGEEGTTIWMNFVDWENLVATMGPTIDEMNARARQAGLPVREYNDGDEVSQVQGCAVYIHSDVPAGTAQIRHGDEYREIPAGGFPPTVAR